MATEAPAFHRVVKKEEMDGIAAMVNKILGDVGVNVVVYPQSERAFDQKNAALYMTIPTYEGAHRSYYMGIANNFAQTVLDVLKQKNLIHFSGKVEQILPPMAAVAAFAFEGDRQLYPAINIAVAQPLGHEKLREALTEALSVARKIHENQSDAAPILGTYLKAKCEIADNPGNHGKKVPYLLAVQLPDKYNPINGGRDLTPEGEGGRKKLVDLQNDGVILLESDGRRPNAFFVHVKNLAKLQEIGTETKTHLPDRNSETSSHRG